MEKEEIEKLLEVTEEMAEAGLRALQDGATSSLGLKEIRISVYKAMLEEALKGLTCSIKK